MAGHDVLGVDIDQARVDALSAGWVPLYFAQNINKYINRMNANITDR